MDGNNGIMRKHATFVSDPRGSGHPSPPEVFCPVPLKSKTAMQALFGVKLGSWEGHVGVSLSPIGVVVVALVAVLLLGLYVLHRDGLLLTGYHLWAGAGSGAVYDPPYPPPRQYGYPRY